MSKSPASHKTNIPIKILVVGDANTGKSSIVTRYVSNFFVSQHKSTIGIEFHLKRIEMTDKIVEVQLWDIAGQDRGLNMPRTFYRNALGALLVYDVSEPKTYDNVKQWKQEIDEKLQKPSKNQDVPFPVVLLANKYDKESSIEPDPNAEAKFVKDNGFLKQYQTSAKTNMNIEESIRFLVMEILKNREAIYTRDHENKEYQKLDDPKASSADGCC